MKLLRWYQDHNKDVLKADWLTQQAVTVNSLKRKHPDCKECAQKVEEAVRLIGPLKKKVVNFKPHTFEEFRAVQLAVEDVQKICIAKNKSPETKRWQRPTELAAQIA